jgi:hypothetical protein
MTWWKNKEPDQITDEPFLHPAVVAYLDRLIQPDWEIAEHGSGGSTFFFAKRASTVFTMESDPDWHTALRKRMPANVQYVLGDYVPIIGEFDLVLIDGEPVEDRIKWLTVAPMITKKGGIVVLDNANRPEYKQERLDLLKFSVAHSTFDGNPQMTKYLVTEFFRMRGGESWV